MQHFFIATPCLNAEKWIDGAISSVVTQRGNFSIHYHVQDGGSCDSTVEHIKKWEEILKTASPIIGCGEISFTWESEPDSGMYEAINKAFGHLSVPPDGIMAWVNADDAYLPHAFATASRVFSDLPDLLWMGGALSVFRESALRPSPNSLQPYPQELIKDYCCDASCWEHLHQASMFWKGTLWRQAGGLDERLRYAGDYELRARFAMHAPFVHLAVPLCCYCSRPGQLSQHQSYREEKEKILPLKERQARVRNFWRKRLHPPLAPSLGWNGENFCIVQRRAWPVWGHGFSFYQRRLRYYASRWGHYVKMKMSSLLS